MAKSDIIVIGASAGGVEALTALTSRLPANLPAAVFVCLHIPPEGHSALPSILNRKGQLTAVHPEDGELIVHSRIYVAPPNNHLLVNDGHVRITLGPKENGARPAIDPLFRSAADAYRDRVAGVILSGVLDDGAAGLAIVKQLGGIAIVQDPEEAAFSSMPKNAMNKVDVDYVLTSENIAKQLIALTCGNFDIDTKDTTGKLDAG